MKIPGIAFCLLMICGCATSFSSLEQVKESRTITIEETHVYKEVGGLIRESWYFGLVKGDYVSTATDKKGTYYLGPPHSVIILYDFFGEKYLETGVLPTEAEKIKCCHGPWFNDTGGVWIPNDSAGYPKLFLIANYEGDGVKKQADENLSNIAPAALLTGGAARSMLQGKVIWGPEIKNEKLLEALRH